MKKTKLTRSLLAACSIVALSAVAYGCSSGHSDAELAAAAEKARMEEARKAEDDKQAALEEEREKAKDAETKRLAQIEAAREAIAAAKTAAAAQAAKDAVNDVATATEAAGLQAAVDERKEALAMMGRAGDQRTALMKAAEMIDTSDLMDADAIAAARSAIAALKAALAAAADVSDAEKAPYQSQVDTAEADVAEAQGALDHAAQTEALSDALEDLQAIDLSGLSDQGAIDDAKEAIAALQTALDNATELSAAEKTAANIELGAANRAVASAQGRTDIEVQKMAISDAVEDLDDIDLDALMTQAEIDAAEAAITALKAALDDGTDLTNADKLEANVELRLAERAVEKAQESLDDSIDDQRKALTNAGKALAAIDTSEDGLTDADAINKARAAVAKLKEALDGATHLSAADKAKYQEQYDEADEAVKTAATGSDREGRRTTQMKGLTDASNELKTALDALSGTQAPTQAQIDAAENALNALNMAIKDAADLTAAEKAASERAVAQAEGRIQGAKQARKIADDAEKRAEDKRKEQEDQAMAATAAKLYAGLEQGLDTGTAAYDGDDIDVSFDRDGDGTNEVTDVPLSEDKKTMVAAHHDWKGTRYTAEPAGDVGMYEAMVYSNVEASTEGDPFNEEYTLTDGALALITSGSAQTAFAAARVGGSNFDQSAGVKQFKLPSPNPDGATRVPIAGTYHGVSGDYVCTPGAGNACGVRVAAEGFELGTVNADTNAFTSNGGTWTFKPRNANTKVMSVPDANYASYGWWIHKSEDDSTYTASAFHNFKGTDTPTVDLPEAGTATYVGGAAGKYALRSSTGGTNDAGHFTARAKLEAEFGVGASNTISGTIDNFVGADGESRPWSVKLNETDITDGGVIDGLGSTDGTAVGTVWTIGGVAADKGGEWSGSLREMGDDSVPQVATGTFYSTYGGDAGNDGRMVGAFGANKE